MPPIGQIISTAFHRGTTVKKALFSIAKECVGGVNATEASPFRCVK